MERITFSPGEFATLFGKSQTWGYRQIYAGKVKTITEYGRILIPAAEVDKILASAGRYEGKERQAPKTKKGYREIAPSLQEAWKRSILTRRQLPATDKAVHKTAEVRSGSKWQEDQSARKNALKRLRRR